MSEATTIDGEPITHDEMAAEDQAFEQLLRGLLGGDESVIGAPDPLLATRLEDLKERVEHYSTHVDTTGEAQGEYHPHLTDVQVFWMLCAIVDYIGRSVPDNFDGVGDVLIEVANNLLATVNA